MKNPHPLPPTEAAFAALMAHAPILVPAVAGARNEARATTAAMHAVGVRLMTHPVDTLVLVSPHSPRRPGEFGIWGGARLEGSLARFGAPEAAVDLPNDAALIGLLSACMEDHGVRAWRIPADELDHGAVVPLWFLTHAGWTGRTVVLSLDGPGVEQLAQAGAAIRDTAARLGRRFAVIASGDMSHRLTDDAPGGYHPRAAESDRRFIAALKAGAWDTLRDWEVAWQEDAGEDAVDSTRLALAAAGWRRDGHEVLSYEAPFGVGYGVAILHDALSARPEVGGPAGASLPGLARRSVNEALGGGAVSRGFPATGPLAKPGGVFVTLRASDGSLRGCVGNIRPEWGSVAEETWECARAAAFRDPRFPPVTSRELPELRFEVSLLHSFAPVRAEDDLDPARFGIVVSSADGRRGVLLPGIPQINTAAEQLDYARRKAGIGSGEPVRVERFEIDKFAESPNPPSSNPGFP